MKGFKMKKFSFVFLFILLVLAMPLSAADNYWQQFVHYNFKVHLDVEKHALTGDGIITYKNNSPDTLDRIYLHLYPNAFKNENSTLAREAKKRGYHRRIDPKNNGYIDILEFRINRKKTDIPPADAPVVAYRIDDTILESMLPEPLPPGEELQLYIKFYEKVRKIMGRAGWRGKQHDFAQWYPKLVVYDEKGWHPDQFHLSGEFYGEFGTFDVSITLPANYIVAATGEVVEGAPGWEWVQVDTSLSDKDWKTTYEKQLEEIEERSKEDTIRTVKFHAEKVHDFAWLASSEFLYEKGEWNSIPVHVLYSKNARKGWSKKVVERSEKVLKWLSTRFGLYPYPQLSVTHGLMGGGMEYPMLVMNSGPWHGLISHEVGHIYFYGMLASDELADSWMDEGFTTYQEGWYQQVNYGKWGYDEDDVPDTNSWKFKLNPRTPRKERTISRLVNYMTSGYNEPAGQYAHKFKGGYGINAYTKGAAIFGMLHKMVGDSLWDKICHTYFDRWAFKHVNEERFQKVCEDVTGEDMGWFFDQWLHKAVTVDYALGKIKKEKQADRKWRTQVEIKRKDEGVMPVDVHLIQSDGKKIVKRWDGKARSTTVDFYTNTKPKKVVLDPNDNILDKNRLNNGDWRIQFLPDNPFAYGYQPRNIYVVKYTPKMWYNDVDGLWLGARFRGSYLNKYKRTELGLTYGLKSNYIGYNLSFAHPLLHSSNKLQFKISGVNREGRAIGEVALIYRTSKMQYYPPFHRFEFSFNTAQLLKGEEKYAQRKIESRNQTLKVSEWESGRVNKLCFDYFLEYEKGNWSSEFGLNFETSQKFFGSEFEFSRLQSELTYIYGSGVNYFASRGFAGTFFGDKAPLQERFYVDGANPRERFEKFYLRSVAAFPEQQHYFFPGGGNMRGYVDQPLATKKILAFSTEISNGFLTPLFRFMLPRRSNIGLTAFFDAGRVKLENEENKNLMDAGVGINLRIRKFYRWFNFRFDFPIWVSEPLPGEKELKFRWVFSFQKAF